MKLGLTTASFNAAIKGGRMNLVKIIEFAGGAGFEGLEIINKRDPWNKDISDDIKVNLVRMREKKQRYFAYGVSFDLAVSDDTERWHMMNKVREAILLASVTNVSNVTLYGCLNEEGATFEDRKAVLVKTIKDCLDLAEMKHVTLCLANDNPKLSTTANLKAVCEEVNSPSFKLCLDLAQIALNDEDPVEALKTLAPFVAEVLVTDVKEAEEGSENVVVTPSGKKLEGCVAGEGIVPLAGVIALLRQLSFEGFVSVCYKGSEEPVVGVERCAVNLKKLLSE
ncbi:sugar phosphate isomerase/epimerase [bacterium]|nr:sugar phosphate isomerase/epimerase [bacterium]